MTSTLVDAAAAAATESGATTRSPRRLAWDRFRRERVAVVAAWVVLGFFVVAVFAPLICRALGIDPNTLDRDALDEYGLPLGRFGGISREHWLGVEPGTGRDLLARLLYGLRLSLGIGLLVTVLTTVVGVVVGIAGGFLRGIVDASISRVTDLAMAFPSLLLIIALNRPMTQRLESWGVPEGNPARVTYIVLVLVLFGWMYVARYIRGHVLSLREREFIEAAVAGGATSRHVMFREILPNLWAPIIVVTSLALPANVGVEAALSFLGVGLLPPASSWGIMLGDSVKYYRADPTYLFIPGTALLLLVLAFNLLGDGIRDALDPKGARSI